MKKLPWTTLQELRGDPELLAKIENAEKLLKSLRAALT
jgi:ParB family chromosome partitioning protein